MIERIRRETEKFESQFNRYKVCVALIPTMKRSRLTFKIKKRILPKVFLREYTSRLDGKKCYNPILTFKGNFGEDNHFSEQSGKRPFMINDDDINKFIVEPANFPSYIGYFDNLFLASREYRKRLKPILLKVLERERIKDDGIVEDIENFEIEPS